MNRVSTITDADKFQLVPLHEIHGDATLWASYIQMREIQEEAHGITGDPDAIQNDADATELQFAPSAQTDFLLSITNGFDEKIDFRYALVDITNQQIVGETAIYPPENQEPAWSNSMVRIDFRGAGIGNVLLARVLEKSQELFQGEDTQAMQSTIRSGNIGSWKRFQKLAEAGLAQYDGEVSGRHSNRKSYKYTVPLTHKGRPVDFMTTLIQESQPQPAHELNEVA